MRDPSIPLAFAKSQSDRYLAEFKEWLAIPSVSTLSQHRADIKRAAEWAAEQLRRIGLHNVEIVTTGRHPIVYGEWLEAPGRPVVLVYGHYDVQPPDPLSEWVSPPFEPQVRGENIYARGAADMKGQTHAVLKALEAWLKSEVRSLPVNVKVLIEGEEEIGSPSLPAFLEANRERLRCDMALNADTGFPRPDLPAIVYGLRGLAYFELLVYGPAHDLHSGIFGGAIHNPAQALCELIAGMHDSQGRVTLPGFYDDVYELTAAERAELARLPQNNDAEWLTMTGAPQLAGEAGYTTLERVGARPTLEVNGLLAGFTGEGSKTVLPAKAMAKLSMRLVPHQDDRRIEEQLRAYLAQNAPPTIRWELKNLTGTPPVLVRRDTPGIRAAAAALEATFGVAPVFRLEGGSVPVVSLLQKILGVDSIIMGCGLQDDNIHAPNEKMHLPTYYRGIKAFIRFFGNL